jgi:hypothetical protein
MYGLGQSPYERLVAISCLWKPLDILFQAIASSLLVHTVESICLAVGTMWDMPRALDFCRCVRQNYSDSMRLVGGLSLLRFRQVLQALVLHTECQWFTCASWYQNRGPTLGPLGFALAALLEGVVCDQVWVWLPWDYFASPPCYCRSRGRELSMPRGAVHESGEQPCKGSRS